MLSIREAGRDDLQAVSDLTAAVYLGEGFSPASSEPVLREAAARATETTLLVAVDSANRLRGAVSLVGEGSSYRQIGRPGELEVRLLAVDAAARGAGTGEALMQEVLRRARVQNAGVVLSTQPTMEAAQRLYVRLGFERRPDRDWARASGTRMLVYELPARREES